MDRLLRKLRAALTEVSPQAKRRIILTLIHKVVVTKAGFALYYYADAEQIRRGEDVASPSYSLNKKLFVSGSFKDLNGGRWAKLVEPRGLARQEQLIVSVKHPVQWIRPKMDLVELAKLRREGWSKARLAKYFGKPSSTVYRNLKRLGLSDGPA